MEIQTKKFLLFEFRNLVLTKIKNIDDSVPLYEKQFFEKFFKKDVVSITKSSQFVSLFNTARTNLWNYVKP